MQFIKLDCILNHKENLNKFHKVEIIKTLSDHNAIKPEINNKIIKPFKFH